MPSFWTRHRIKFLFTMFVFVPVQIWIFSQSFFSIRCGSVNLACNQVKPLVVERPKASIAKCFSIPKSGKLLSSISIFKYGVKTPFRNSAKYSCNAAFARGSLLFRFFQIGIKTSAGKGCINLKHARENNIFKR